MESIKINCVKSKVCYCNIQLLPISCTLITKSTKVKKGKYTVLYTDPKVPKNHAPFPPSITRLVSICKQGLARWKPPQITYQWVMLARCPHWSIIRERESTYSPFRIMKLKNLLKTSLPSLPYEGEPPDQTSAFPWYLCHHCEHPYPQSGWHHLTAALALCPRGGGHQPPSASSPCASNKPLCPSVCCV